jgi:hypothetical protein
MGIYTSGRVFGIAFHSESESESEGYVHKHYEKTYPKEMTTENIKEAYDMYNTLDKNKVLFFVYMECSITHEQKATDTFCWFPSTREYMEGWFTSAR